MLYKTLLLLFSFALLGTSRLASATSDPLSVGYFFCTACTMQQPAMDPSTRVFISVVVNQHVTSWQAANGQLKNVTICNASVCIKWQYTASGQFLSVSVSNNDGSHDYVATDDGGIAGGGAGGGGTGITPPGSGGVGGSGGSSGGGGGSGGGVCHWNGEVLTCPRVDGGGGASE
jgi:uncharacterized membrane protein YgcG